MTVVLAFGSDNDKQAWELSERIRGEFPGTKFINTDRPDDILRERGSVLIIDVVRNLERAEMLGIDDLGERQPFSLHDFDLGFFLKLMKKSGMLEDMRIIGIPEKWDENTVNEVRELLRSL
jgi:hypothetical protein